MEKAVSQDPLPLHPPSPASYGGGPSSARALGMGVQEPIERTHLDGTLPNDLAQLGNVIVLLDGCPQIPVIIRLDSCWFTPKSSLGRGDVSWTRGTQGRGAPPREPSSLASGSKDLPSLSYLLAHPSWLSTPAPGSGPGSRGCGWGCSTSQRSHSGSRAGHPHAQPGQPVPGSGRKDPATPGWPYRWGVGWDEEGRLGWTDDLPASPVSSVHLPGLL